MYPVVIRSAVHAATRCALAITILLPEFKLENIACEEGKKRGSLHRSINAYRPHPTHSQAHRDFAVLRLIRDTFAVRVRLGDPRVVPSFHCPFLPDMPPSMSPGRSESCFFQFTDSDMGLRQDLNGSALPTILPSVSSRARISGLIDSPLLRPVRLLAPLDGSDRVLSRPRGLLHPGFQRVSHLSHCWTLLRQSLDSSVGGTFTHWNVS